MIRALPFENALSQLLNETRQSEIGWQLGMLAACGLLSWLIMRWVFPRLTRRDDVWRKGLEGLKRVGLPLLALLLVLTGRAVLSLWQPVHLLNLAVPLLGALVLVRVLVYMLRYALPGNEAIKTWERLIAWIIWIGLALHITGMLPRILRALDAVSFDTGTHHFSLLLLLEAVTLILIAVIAALWFAKLIEARLMGVHGMDLNLRLALIKATRTLLIVFGVLVALPAVGIDITVLSVFGGAIAVGLGFGLQKIASNYISGFIILLDRSIRPGDMLTVDNRYGEVSHINTRYTLLKALDGTEIIIPNETLITSTVINHSLSKRDIRLALPIQISYDSPLERAMEILVETASKHSRVLLDDSKEEPRVLIKGFGESGIDLELGVWIADPEGGQANLRSELYMEIWKKFRAEDIEIPYPRRDVHLIKPGKQKNS